MVTSHVGYVSNLSIRLCIISCKLGKSLYIQPQINVTPSYIRLTIVSAMSDVCGASNSTWSETLIESTSTPMTISSGIALAPVLISVLLQRCSRTSCGKLLHFVVNGSNLLNPLSRYIGMALICRYPVIPKFRAVSTCLSTWQL